MRVHRAVSLLVTGCSLLVLASCGEAPSISGPPVPPPQAGLFGNLLGGMHLLQCSPLQPDSVTQTIGPSGGTLSVGPHQLVVPAGALSQAVAVTAIVASESVNRVQFFPEGLTFAEPAALTMSYANCSLLGILLPKRIAYTTGGLQLLEWLGSVDNLFSAEVTGEIEHFSNYAVAW